MTRRKGPLPSPNTFPELLLTIIALSGEVPSALVSRLPGSDSYKAYAIKILKREKLLRTYYHDGLRGLRLTTTAKRLLAAGQPDRYRPLFTGDTATNAPKYSVPHRLRLHRMAEVLVAAYNAGLLTFPWEKPSVFQTEPGDTNLYIGPAYYSSREVKEIGAQATMIRGSRATGILLCDGGIYAVYNTASARMKWEYKAEVRLKAMIQTDLCHGRLARWFMDSPPGAIVFGDGMDQLEHLMGPGSKETRNYLIMDGTFRCFHYLTLDHRGEVLLRLLCDPERKAELDEILSQDLSKGSTNWLIEHDAISIPAIGVKDYYLWQGETAASMNKGLGHFTSTSVWDGNVALCGHNRGAKYVIGSIKDLEVGDTVTYTTSAGTRTYEVETVRKIASNDWSYLEPTSDNRITMITCVSGDYSVRWMVQAVETN